MFFWNEEALPVTEILPSVLFHLRDIGLYSAYKWLITSMFLKKQQRKKDYIVKF